LTLQQAAKTPKRPQRMSNEPSVRPDAGSLPEPQTINQIEERSVSIESATAEVQQQQQPADDDAIVSLEAAPAVAAPPAAPAQIADDDEEEEDDDEDEYEYEDEDDACYSGFLQTTAAAHTEVDTVKKEKFSQPSREAVTMSLRAEQETTGGKRRLAQDLYRIMSTSTKEKGFHIEPMDDDNMKSWKMLLSDFDADSKLAQDMAVLGVEAIELQMDFPDDYPFQPPFCRVVSPRFQRQTGFVMNGALCMELLTSDGWNPVNDIESVIVSIRSLLVVGDGRLEAAMALKPADYQAALDGKPPPTKKARGTYSQTEAKAAYSHLEDYHKKKGWDSSGWWAKKG